MIKITSYQNKNIAVFGLGRSGMASARALMASGATVSAWDDAAEARGRAAGEGIPLADLYKCDWSQLTALILAPGIPLNYPEPHELVTAARNGGCEVIGDVELLIRASTSSPFIGITGTNGKSTTTALIGHTLKAAGMEAEVGGNIGRPVLDFAHLSGGGRYVLEMSSYQLDLTPSAAFDVAVLLNISADHLDRHGGLDGYIESKKKIFRNQTGDQTAIVGVDDRESRKVFEELKATGKQTVIPISGSKPVAGGIYVMDGALIDNRDGNAEPVLDVASIKTLPGEHNHQNVAAAFAAVTLAGVDRERAAQAIRSFPGLVHRQERVGEIDGVTYINDSKATNAEAAARALACYGDIYWIAGGRAKDGGYEVLRPYLGNVRRAFLIGEAANDIAAFLDGSAGHEDCGDLSTAFARASETAKGEKIHGAVVLLSPAAASFDQFRDFEARGDAFRDLVAGIAGPNGSNDNGEAA